MIQEDTIKLLGECERGVEMGIESIDTVMGSVSSDRMKKKLNFCKDEHGRLKDEIASLLKEYHDEPKGASPVIKGMSYMKTKMTLMMNSSDHKIADIMIDGCNMGVKSLSKYLNEYAAASERSKDIAKKLIALEEKLAVDLREYL
jgi:hypothetical protein